MIIKDMSVTKFNMTYGLYLGLGFIFVILFFHILGHLHFPGDQSGWINSALLGFFMVFSIRKYQKEMDIATINYQFAFRMGVQLSFFSSVILAFFLYWYYGFIADNGIANFIDMIEIALAESGTFPESQQEILMQTYRNGLTTGSMAFACGLSQFFLGLFMSLVMPLFLKSTNRLFNK